ncbi:hypothetical protein BS78_02G273300 [Paspalum vaginatum]|nr:hypothetical protein BS78_02G273300 [Paspalum vaginatum]
MQYYVAYWRMAMVGFIHRHQTRNLRGIVDHDDMRLIFGAQRLASRIFFNSIEPACLTQQLPPYVRSDRSTTKE